MKTRIHSISLGLIVFSLVCSFFTIPMSVSANATTETNLVCNGADPGSDINSSVIKNHLKSNKKGIVYANVDNFAFYEFAEEAADGSRPSWAGWRGFGGALDIDYLIPRNSKAGDYFTLSWDPETILIKHEPMYRENETVPYESLMTEPSKYKNGASNIFFVIRTPAGVDIPNVPLLNVYHTKVNELTFVVQPYAEGRKELIGSSVIGNRVDPRRLFAYTDGNGRHMRKDGLYGRIKPDGWNWGNIIGNEVYDFKESSIDPTAIEANGRHYYLFMGIEPSYEGMSRNANSLNPNAELPTQRGDGLYDRYIYHRNLHYYTKYKDEPSTRIEDGGCNIYGTKTTKGAEINYSTWLLRYDHYVIAGARQGKGAATGHGREVLVDVYEDKDFLYGYFIYNANRGSQFKVCDPNRSSWCWSPGDFQGTYTMDLDNVDNSLTIEELILYQGYDNGPLGDFTNATPTTALPVMANYPNSRADIGAYKVNGDATWRIDFPRRERNSYVGKVKMRKNKLVNGKYTIKMTAYTGLPLRPRRENFTEYEPTRAIGVTSAFVTDASYNFFNLKKTDTNGNLVEPAYAANQPVNDVNGNTYTLTDANNRFYVGSDGRNYRQKQEDGHYVYVNDKNELFFEHTENGVTYFLDQYGRRFDQKADAEGTYATRQTVNKHNLLLASRPTPGREAEGLFNYDYQIDGETYGLTSSEIDADQLGSIDTLESGNGKVYRLRLENTSKNSDGNKDPRSVWHPMWIESNEQRIPLLRTGKYSYGFGTGITDTDKETEVFKPLRPVLNVTEMKVFLDRPEPENNFYWRYYDEQGNPLQVLGEQDLYRGDSSERQGRLITLRDRVGNIIHIEHKQDGYVARLYDETYKVLQINRVSESGKEGFKFLPTTEKMYIKDIHTQPALQNTFVFRLINAKTRQTHEVKINEYGYFNFDDLDPEDTYILEETSAPSNYKRYPGLFVIRPTGNGIQFYKYIDNPNGEPTYELIGAESNPLALIDPTENLVTLKNERRFKIKLFKRDAVDTSQGLDARFELWHATGNQITGERYIDIGNTNQAGNSLLFQNEEIIAGRYAFKEVSAPQGYDLLPEPIFFTITSDGRVIDISDTETAEGKLDTEDNQTILLTIKNYQPYELPKTGGISDWSFLLGGTFLMLITISVMKKKTRQILK